VQVDKALRERLWEQYRRGRDVETRRELVLAYLPLVKYLAGRLKLRPRVGLTEEDLEAYGVIGLLEALERYDPNRGAEFETFARRRIQGAMLDALRRQDWAPRSVRERLHQVAGVVRVIEQEKKAPATDEEVATRLGWPVSRVQEAWLEAHETALTSLEELLFPGEGQDSSRPAADPESPDPARVYEENELRALLARALSELGDPDRLVLNLYYYEGLTLKEIGAVLGVSESRACQLRGRALLRLRARLKEWGY
jgi:RNA polymerase sigma factor for flagellar operon FliA